MKKRYFSIILVIALLLLLPLATSVNAATNCEWKYGVDRYVNGNGNAVKVSWSRLTVISGTKSGHSHYARAYVSTPSSRVGDSGRIWAYNGGTAYARSGEVLDSSWDFLCEAFYGH